MRAASVARRLAQFAQLTEIENACKLMRGDLLVQLIDEDGLRRGGSFLKDVLYGTTP